MAEKRKHAKRTVQKPGKNGYPLKGRTRSQRLREAMRARAVMKDSLPALRVAANNEVAVPDPDNPEMAAFLAKNALDGGTLLTMLADVSRSVCRIDRVVGSERFPVATGILIAPDKVMTCRHVLHDCDCKLKEFGEDGRRWQMPEEGSIEAVFGAQPFQSSIIRPIESVVYGDNVSGRSFTDEVLEVAIVQLRPLPDGEIQPGDPMPLVTNDSTIASRAAIAVIGFPGAGTPPADQPVSDAILRVFGTDAELNKRHMLIGVGTLEESGIPRTAARYYTHFAPTMPGMSGGAVIDLASGSLVGLHASGTHFKENRFHLFGPMLRFLGSSHPFRKDIDAL